MKHLPTLLLGLILPLLPALPAQAVTPGEPRPAFVPGGRPARLGVVACSTTRGVLIQGIVPGSPAHRAGLEAGDLILTVDGFVVGFIDGVEYPLQSELRRAGPTVSLEVKDRRTDRILVVRVPLQEAPEKTPEPVSGPGY